MTVEGVQDLTQAGVLELFMYYFYRVLEEETSEARLVQGVREEPGSRLLDVARAHADAEYNDLQRIEELIRPRLNDLNVRRTLSTCLAREIEGNFLAFRAGDTPQQLFEHFRLRARSQGDDELAGFFEETAVEEVEHERALQDLYAALGGGTSLEPTFLTEDQFRTYLRRAHQAMYGAGSEAEVVAYLRGMVRDSVGPLHIDRLRRLIEHAQCAYWSYCKQAV